jgi:sulfotransferase family protein
VRASFQSPKVAYVLGVYRSGTTLLSNLMGQLDGFFCVGELRAIWRELGDPNARCGCGAPLTECETWQAILATAYGGVAEAQELAPRMLRWQTQVLRQSHTWQRVPALLRRRQLGSLDGAGQHYAERLSRLYRAISKATGARVVVDSSKEATDAAMVRLLPDTSTYFVHIVRDPRGTVFSSIRARSDGEARSEMQWARSGYTALSWVAGNLAAAAVRRAHNRQQSMVIRYEDLIQAPDPALGQIARLVEEPAAIPSADDGTMVMAPTHTVAGNENRFRTGRVHLVQDTAWRNNLTRVDQFVVAAICSPLMVRYGYRLKP